MIDTQYLMSSTYLDNFLVHGNYQNLYNNIDDASGHGTDDYNYRHGKIANNLGVWRWKGMFLFRNIIVPKVFFGKGVDFGGVQGPVSSNAVVVDLLSEDNWGRPVEHHSLSEVNFQCDFIFSSHTIEHIDDIEYILSEFYKLLKPNGNIILHLPSYTCKRWRADTGIDMGGTPHIHTFCLYDTDIDVNIKNMISIYPLVNNYFSVNVSKYTGDNSIMIIGKKNE